MLRKERISFAVLNIFRDISDVKDHRIIVLSNEIAIEKCEGLRITTAKLSLEEGRFCRCIGDKNSSNELVL